jgi:hypothetical protein
MTPPRRSGSAAHFRLSALTQRAAERGVSVPEPVAELAGRLRRMTEPGSASDVSHDRQQAGIDFEEPR